ncbi:NAD-dependent epimerase/dehydratase family protein [Aquipuribacter nitratireducens]|uniref:NAD-dependent epimerase/dehydratase family protein n=1 Tax=Aquipuribacter nitratireducens TaxID=650104 RepID=A0ABW0GMF6_9MICO
MSRLVRIVVTGSSGFIGSRLVARVLSRGDDVVAVDRRPAPPAPLAAAARDGAGALATVRADLADPTDPWTATVLRLEAAAADAVVHCAALSGVRAAPGTSHADLEAARARDILASAETVLAATPLATPLVVLSSSAVYGGCLDATGTARPSRETDPVRPVGRYAAWKVAVEEACRARTAAGGTVTVARPFTVLGEGQRPDMAVAAWLDAARTGRALRVLGDLGRRRDVTDVDVVVDGVLAVLDRGATGVVNLGSGRPRTLAEIVDAVRRAVVDAGCAGGPLRLHVAPAAAEEVPASWAATDRLRALGVDPATDLDAVVRRQLAHTLAVEATTLAA